MTHGTLFVSPGVSSSASRQALARRHLAKKRVAKMRGIQMRVWSSQDFPEVSIAVSGSQNIGVSGSLHR